MNSHNQSNLETNQETNQELDLSNNPAINMESPAEYIYFTMNCPLGCDMSGRYFIQLTGNESAIRKFKKINKNMDKYELKFYRERYYREDILQLKKFKGLFNLAEYDNVEVLMFSGKLNVPGENRGYSREELTNYPIDGWWEKYLDSAKCPKWNNIVEEVTNLVSI